MRRSLRFAPLAAALVVAAIPLWQYGQRIRAEAAGEVFLARLARAQLEFRRRHGVNFATTLDSLTALCAGEPATALEAGAVREIADRGFVVLVRAAAGAAEGVADCHGRPTAADYYAALEPAAPDAPPRRAYAMTGLGGRIFVFVDGIAPLERDMTPGGLATPLDQLGAFKIP